jgi:hypothetical protein
MKQYNKGYNKAIEDVRKDLIELLGFNKPSQAIANQLVGFIYGHLDKLKEQEQEKGE